MSPVEISSDVLGSFYANVLNSFMDHGWDGFYTSQKRLPRFPAIVKGKGPRYIVRYIGSPPDNQRFKLIGNPSTIGVTVRIDYTRAFVYVVSDSSKNPIKSNPWDEANGKPLDIRGNVGCGENRFEGVSNILEFFLLPNCVLYISKLDSI